jgi:hypothetical protein
MQCTPEFVCLRSNLLWWLSERPEVLIGFVREKHERLLASYNMWIGSWGSWRDMPECRSAVEFLSELGVVRLAHPSLATRLEREVGALDKSLEEGVHKCLHALALRRALIILSCLSLSMCS